MEVGGRRRHLCVCGKGARTEPRRAHSPIFFLGVVTSPPLHKMMREILAMLATHEGEHEPDEANSNGLPGGHPDVEPIPFVPTLDGIQEPSSSELAELKRKLRLKLTSRRFTRRRKEENAINASLLTEQQQDLSRHARVEECLGGPEISAPQDRSQPHQELQALTQELMEASTLSFNLAAQMGPLNPHFDCLNDPDCGSGAASIAPVPLDLGLKDQVTFAMQNLHKVIEAIAGRRDKLTALWFQTFMGWRLLECKRRGSRYTVLASKRFSGASRGELGHRIWTNARDQTRRIVLNLLHSNFVVLSKLTPIDDSSAAFTSQDVHEFPSPFLSREINSVHGIKTEDSLSTYVKQSLTDPSQEPSCVDASEIMGVVLRDATDSNGLPCVDVDLVMMYDTKAVCHVELVMFQDPPLCNKVLMRWEEPHSA